jgi:hypothetical protein
MKLREVLRHAAERLQHNPKEADREVTGFSEKGLIYADDKPDRKEGVRVPESGEVAEDRERSER